MKKLFSFAAIIMCSLLLFPLSAIEDINEAVAVISTSDNTKTEETEDTFRICYTSTDQVEELSADDYIFGVVAAEMPALYEEEALKAQAVAAYTFACYRKTQNADKNYDLTDDYLSDQSYITKTEAEKKWGDNAAEYTKKIEEILEQVKGYAVTYQGKPILAVYHAISSGKTESAENVWGKEYPYLISVESYGDKLCDGYMSTVSVSEETFKETLKDEVTLSGEAANFVSDISRTDAGTVKSLKLCGSEITGAKIRSLFQLRSSNFEIEYKDGNFNFTVYGYGHAVGLSQNGADYMAKQGSDFKEILNHYYTGCEIEKLN